MARKRPGLVAVNKKLVRELSKDPYWREKLGGDKSTAEAIKIIPEFGKAKGYGTDEAQS